VTKAEKVRLRRRFDNAVLREEDLKVALADDRRELEAIRGFDPRRAAYFAQRITVLEQQLKQTRQEVDELQRQVRDLDLPAPEPPHPGGAVGAILERDKKPRVYNTGGDIKDRNAGWDAPEVEGSNRRRQRK
jgi:hypothetical protein